MLETPQERVELLKAGISGKKIEELYIAGNNFRIVHTPTLCEKVGINPERFSDKCTAINQKVANELYLQNRIGVGLSCQTPASHHQMQEKGTFPMVNLKEAKMKKNGDRIKILLNDVEKQFYRLTPQLQVRFAIEQMSIWQRRFNGAKNRALKENFVDTTLRQNKQQCPQLLNDNCM